MSKDPWQWVDGIASALLVLVIYALAAGWLA